MTNESDTWIGVVNTAISAPELYPATIAAPKCLLPVYNKPLIYYPISVLLLAGIRRIAILAAVSDTPAFQRLLGDGSQFGVEFTYVRGFESDGAIESYARIPRALANKSVAWISGDTLVHADYLEDFLADAMNGSTGAKLIVFPMLRRESRFIVNIRRDGMLDEMGELADTAQAATAGVGLLLCSARARMEMDGLIAARGAGARDIDVFMQMQSRGLLRLHVFDRGFAWFDSSTHSQLNAAANYVQAIETNRGLKIGCLEEVAVRKGYVSHAQILKIAAHEKSG